jgi:hypothetical protein
MSTIQATNIKHASSASNNLALDSSGNATFANNVAVPSINSGPLAGFRNVIINGGFDIWQRGTSFTSTSVNEYSADRFRTEGNSLSTTISRQAFTANQTDVPGYPTYYCRVATSATVGAGQYWAFQQRVEAPQNLSGYEQITLTFYARATSGTIAANTFSFGSLATKVGNPALTTAWSKLTTTITLSGPSSGYVEIYLVYLAAGTTAVSIDIAQVQVESGSVSTPFEHRPIGTELALCQRYYQKYTQPPLRGVMNGATGAARCGMILPVEMRVAPTAAAGLFNVFDGSGVGTISSTSASYLDTNVVEFDFVTNSFSAATRPAVIYQNGTESLTLSAEL